MSLLGTYWHKICEPLDGYLWHSDITHRVIRPLLRNQILACGACILAGAAAYAVFPWLFWFGCGLVFISWVFWSWARFFLRLQSMPPLAPVLIRFFIRLIILALVLLACLAWLKAPVSAILAGMVSGSFLGLGTYAWKVFHDGVTG